jgi:hypothetical protein
MSESRTYSIQIPTTEILDVLQKNFIGTQSQIVSLYNGLLKYFISTQSQCDELLRQSMIDELKKDRITKEGLNGEFEYLQHDDIRTIAIDLPVLMTPKNSISNESIMVVAMDPLPPNVNQNAVEKNKIGYWVPFSLIDSDSTGEKSFKSNMLFFNELCLHYTVYVTDIFKLFFRKGEYGTDLRSNADKHYTGLNAHKSILMAEIEAVQPKAIVTLGNRARNGLLALSITKPKPWETIQTYTVSDFPPIVSIPHISGAANGTASKILKRYPEITGAKNQRLARLVVKELSQL